MPQSKVALISRKAKKIRKKGEPWTSAIKRASRMISGTVSSSRRSSKPGKKSKSVPKKKTGYKPRKPTHQTGTSSKKRDEMKRAMPPGKRTVKTSKGTHTYYEYRRNRSDMPGKLTGGLTSTTYRYNIMQRITSNVRLLNEAEERKRKLERTLKAMPRTDKMGKNKVRSLIQDQRNYIRTLKKDISGFKLLLK